jgi:hypothetical protein
METKSVSGSPEPQQQPSGPKPIPAQLPAAQIASMNKTPRAVSVKEIEQHRVIFNKLNEGVSWGNFINTWRKFGWTEARQNSSRAQKALDKFCTDLGCAKAKTVEKLLKYSQASAQEVLNFSEKMRVSALDSQSLYEDDITDEELHPVNKEDAEIFEPARADLKNKYTIVKDLLEALSDESKAQKEFYYENAGNLDADLVKDKTKINELRVALHDLRIANDNFKNIAAKIKNWQT